MVVVEKSFKELKGKWIDLYSSNSRISPFMDYHFHQYYNRLGRIRDRSVKQNNKKYILIDDCLILPVNESKNELRILGESASVSYLDFIYGSDMTAERLAALIDEFVHTYKTKLDLMQINESSLLFEALHHVHDAVISEEQYCVNINFSQGYDNYFASLSKSVRQNVRTAHNRMEREGLEYHTDVHISEPIPFKILNQIVWLMSKRLSQRKNHKYNYLRFLLRRFADPVEAFIKNASNNVWSITYINGKMAACLFGMITNSKKTVCVPKLAINTDFSVYCPGSLLITDTIKYLSENSEIVNLDLERGTEKYKFSLGGAIHENYSCFIDGTKKEADNRF